MRDELHKSSFSVVEVLVSAALTSAGGFNPLRDSLLESSVSIMNMLVPAALVCVVRMHAIEKTGIGSIELITASPSITLLYST